MNRSATCLDPFTNRQEEKLRWHTVNMRCILLHELLRSPERVTCVVQVLKEATDIFFCIIF